MNDIKNRTTNRSKKETRDTAAHTEQDSPQHGSRSRSGHLRSEPTLRMSAQTAIAVSIVYMGGDEEGGRIRSAECKVQVLCISALHIAN